MSSLDPTEFERLLERLRRHRFPPSREEPPPAEHAAVAHVLRPGPTGPELLLMRRAEHELDPWSGHVSLPGGRLDPTDATLLAAALRETREEVGVDLERAGELVREMPPLRARARGVPLDLAVTPFVFAARAPLTPCCGPEAAEVFWLPLLPAARGAFDDVHRFERDGEPRELPCWRFEGRVVWGMTYRMTTDLLRAAGLLASS